MLKRRICFDDETAWRLHTTRRCAEGYVMFKFCDLIEEVSEFNTDLKYGLEDIIGVTIEKGLIPTVANLTQTALDKFYIVRPNTFIYNPRTHGVRLGMGFNETDNVYITSWNNVAFKVKDSAKQIVLPKYLWLYFLRPDWDRLSNFLAWGSSTIVFAWKDFLDIEISLPSIEKQREIVAEYNTLATRIETNKKLIATLEQTAQTLYRHTFIDNIDPNNLPEGWRMGTLGEFGKVVTGKTPSSECPEDFDNDVPFVTPGDFQVYKKLAIGAERGLSIDGAQKLKTKIIPKKSILVTCIGSDMGKTAITTEDCITNQQINAINPKDDFTCQYLYYMLKDMEAILKSIALGGSTMPMLSKSSFEVIPVLIPSAEIMQQFYRNINAADDMILNKFKENQALTQMQTLLLSKMGV